MNLYASNSLGLSQWPEYRSDHISEVQIGGRHIGACTQWFVIPVSGMPISSSTVTVREESSAITVGRLAQTVTLIGISSDS